jgi:hypothetical protein
MPASAVIGSLLACASAQTPRPRTRVRPDYGLSLEVPTR